MSAVHVLVVTGLQGTHRCFPGKWFPLTFYFSPPGCHYWSIIGCPWGAPIIARCVLTNVRAHMCGWGAPVQNFLSMGEHFLFNVFVCTLVHSTLCIKWHTFPGTCTCSVFQIWHWIGEIHRVWVIIITFFCHNCQNFQTGSVYLTDACATYHRSDVRCRTQHKHFWWQNLS